MIDYNEIKPILRQAARGNFWAFCCYYDWDFFHDKRRFLKDIAIAFQYVIDEYKNGNALKVSVSMPPRAGKSYITSLYSAYWLTTFPELSVMRNTCTSTLYDKFSYDTRAIIRNIKFKEVFPNIELAVDKQNLDGWNLKTSKQCAYFGAGVGGTIIGFGANLAITDDLYKSMQDALSSNRIDFVRMWKESAHDSRKEKNCPEIFIGTRWVKNDIIGESIDGGKIDINIKIPALIDGNSFCEDVKTTPEYLEIQQTIDESVWNAEYMQDPLNPKGRLLPLSELTFADTSNIPEENIIYRVAFGDPADKGGDKFSMPFIHVAEIEGKICCFVKDVIHNTAGIEANAPRVIEKSHEYGIDNLIFEVNGVGLAALLLVKPILLDNQKLIPWNSKVQKETRIQSHYEFVKKFFIFDKSYESNPEYKLYITDLTSYQKEGDNKHKIDAIDSCCLAAHIIKTKYYKQIYK